MELRQLEYFRAIVDAGTISDGVTGKFTMDKSGSPTKSVTVLEMKDGKPVYNTTVQPK